MDTKSAMMSVKKKTFFLYLLIYIAFFSNLSYAMSFDHCYKERSRDSYNVENKENNHDLLRQSTLNAVSQNPKEYKTPTKVPLSHKRDRDERQEFATPERSGYLKKAKMLPATPYNENSRQYNSRLVKDAKSEGEDPWPHRLRRYVRSKGLTIDEITEDQVRKWFQKASVIHHNHKVGVGFADSVLKAAGLLSNDRIGEFLPQVIMIDVELGTETRTVRWDGLGRSGPADDMRTIVVEAKYISGADKEVHFSADVMKQITAEAIAAKDFGFDYILYFGSTMPSDRYDAFPVPGEDILLLLENELVTLRLVDAEGYTYRFSRLNQSWKQVELKREDEPLEMVSNSNYNHAVDIFEDDALLLANESLADSVSNLSPGQPTQTPSSLKNTLDGKYWQ